MDIPPAITDLLARLHTATQANSHASAEAEGLSVIFDLPYIVLDLDHEAVETLRENQEEMKGIVEGPASSFKQPNCPVIALAHTPVNLEEVPAFVDVLATSEDELETLKQGIQNNPVAATILVQVLRHNEHASLMDGLFAESLSYSCLQHGSGFRTWLDARKVSEAADEDESSLVLMGRQHEILTITLNRPHKRNAYSAALRDAFHEALVLVATDKTITRALVRGAGTCFSAGGDLHEFGEASDSAYAHLVRMTKSTPALLDQLKGRTDFYLHGACIGAGIELPAFSDNVVAAADSFFQLPEVSMGLIPGAGGTVSIQGRIGRLRTAFIALSNQRISAETALHWGLIDEIR